MKTSVYTENQIKELVDDLNAGYVVAVATDTVMGLAARADLQKTLDCLKKIKERPGDKPFPIMVANLSQLQEIVDLNKRNQKLVDKWFPGAITFILNKKSDAHLCGVGTSLAVRMPNDKILLEIVESLGKPIFLTSANKSNQPSTMKASETLEIFNGEIKSILMRDARGYKASTIIDATGVELKQLRVGKISIDKVNESLEE